MKISHALSAVGLAVALAVSGISGASAIASTNSEPTAAVHATAIAPHDDEVTISDEDPSSSIAARGVRNVGGGTWNYGSKLVKTKSGIQRKCWSHYYHRTRAHSATAIIGGVEVTKTTKKGKWAKANAYGSSFETCKTKWSAHR